jgi:hypothetical protein
VAEELAAETSEQGLGPAAKPISRALLKIAGDGMVSSHAIYIPALVGLL